MVCVFAMCVCACNMFWLLFVHATCVYAMCVCVCAYNVCLCMQRACMQCLCVCACNVFYMQRVLYATCVCACVYATFVCVCVCNVCVCVCARNRAMRLLYSCKFGKVAVLMPCVSNEFSMPSTTAVGTGMSTPAPGDDVVGCVETITVRPVKVCGCVYMPV